MADLLITTRMAAEHLRIDLPEVGDEREVDLLLKMQQANDIIVDYLKYFETGWSAENVPTPIQAAILLVLADLWENRGGDGAGDYLAPGGVVARLLNRLRDPAMA